MERKYVILNRPYRIRKSGFLSYWGNYTRDEKKRSYSGYTNDLDKCEKYTLEELKNSGYELSEFNKKDFDNPKNKDICFYATVEEIEKAFAKARRIIIY